MTSRPITTSASAGAHHHYYPSPRPLRPPPPSAAAAAASSSSSPSSHSLSSPSCLSSSSPSNQKSPNSSSSKSGSSTWASAPHASSATFSLIIRMLFTATDNKVGIKYRESTFTIMYRGIPLGRGVVPGFFQPAHSVRRIETAIVVDRVNLLQADAADLLRDASLNDRVELRVVGDVGAKIRILGFTSPGVQSSVHSASGGCVLPCALWYIIGKMRTL
ncbi:hypothetical protein Sango_0513100 [Sesamum angolense]|uniref:Late embryogenesis abundant protein LEA-2 subgroup domain-containing protein n=1 Tax=Sesamum angolense TaxID=2727404 RepID=A0AAE2C104_9LAMI|nr:hypothetical protein Sango_0513100 [Sesamum angolense]